MKTAAGILAVAILLASVPSWYGLLVRENVGERARRECNELARVYTEMVEHTQGAQSQDAYTRVVGACMMRTTVLERTTR